MAHIVLSSGCGWKRPLETVLGRHRNPRMKFPIQGLVHQYAPRKIAFEFNPTGSKKALIFVGGLMDGLLTVPYLETLAKEVAAIGYSLIQIQISSSHIGWGTGSLERDSTEISQLVGYLKSEEGGAREVIGLMGHSTGCQNTTHYFNRQPRSSPAQFSAIDFGILQAPVSDRITAGESLPKDTIEESLEIANRLISNGQPTEIMPSRFTKHFFDVPINAYRWNSLIAVRGDDDFFSPDLDDSDFASTFGKFDKPFLVLYSGADEYVPAWLDKKALMARWEKAAGSNWSPYSKVVDGALHNIGEGSAPGAEEEAVRAVVQFLSSI